MRRLKKREGITYLTRLMIILDDASEKGTGLVGDSALSQGHATHFNLLPSVKTAPGSAWGLRHSFFTPYNSQHFLSRLLKAFATIPTYNTYNLSSSYWATSPILL